MERFWVVAGIWGRCFLVSLSLSLTHDIYVSLIEFLCVCTQDGVVCLWNVNASSTPIHCIRDGDPVSDQVTAHSPTSVFGVAFQPNSDTVLASVGRDTNLFLHDIRLHRPVSVLRAQVVFYIPPYPSTHTHNILSSSR